MKVKTYNRSALYNALHSLIVTLSPRTPRTKRQTYKQIKQTNERRTRDARLLKALSQ